MIFLTLYLFVYPTISLIRLNQMEKAMLNIVFFNRSCNDKERFDEDGKNAVFNCNVKVHYGLKTAKILATL